MRIFCSVCQEDRDPAEVVTYALDQCGHEFCRECVQGWVANRVYDGHVAMPCPQNSCNEKMSKDEIRDVLEGDADVIAKYDRNVALQGDDTRECPECESINIRTEDTEGNQMECIVCGAEFCFVHGQAHARDETCEEFERRLREEDPDTFDLIHSECKTCPSCFSATYRFAGCDQMTCSRCRRSWCWNCIATRNSCQCGVLEHTDDPDYMSDNEYTPES